MPFPQIPHPKRMESHTFELGYREQIGINGFTGRIGRQLSAEEARLRRLLPDPPAGYHWECSMEQCEDLPNYVIKYRVVYRLKESQ